MSPGNEARRQVALLSPALKAMIPRIWILGSATAMRSRLQDNGDSWDWDVTEFNGNAVYNLCAAEFIKFLEARLSVREYACIMCVPMCIGRRAVEAPLGAINNAVRPLVCHHRSSKRGSRTCATTLGRSTHIFHAGPLAKAPSSYISAWSTRRRSSRW